MISQQLSGHRVDVVDEEGGGARARLTRAEVMHLAARAPHDGATEPSLPSRLARLCDANRGGDGALPLRAILAPEEAVSSRPHRQQPTRGRPARSSSIIRTAQTYFTSTSYLWRHTVGRLLIAQGRAVRLCAPRLQLRGTHGSRRDRDGCRARR
jgi:hypothetical protein